MFGLGFASFERFPNDFLTGDGAILGKGNGSG
jgi:hypothetical protein